MMMLTAEIQKNYNKKTSEQKYYEISPNSLSLLLFLLKEEKKVA